MRSTATFGFKEDGWPASRITLRKIASPPAYLILDSTVGEAGEDS